MTIMIDKLIDEPRHPEGSNEQRLELKRGPPGTIDGFKVSALTDTGAAQDFVSGNFSRARKLKRGLLGTIDGFKVSALADTGAAQNVVSSNFARARKLDVVGPPSSFRLGNSKLAHSLGTSKN